MTTQGTPQLGAKGQVRLRRFIWNATKDKSASDTSQVPVAATVTIYKQGATAQAQGSASGSTGTIEVWSPGQLKVGDTIIASTTDDSVTATVSSVTTTQIGFTGGTGFAWAADERIVVTDNQPVLYTDEHAEDATGVNTVTLNARGHGSVFTEQKVVDYKLSGSGLTTVYISGYYAASHDSEIRQIEHFPGANFGAKLANALNDLNETTGGIVDCRGMIGEQTISADPFASVTWPYEVLIGASTISHSVALTACAEPKQHIKGIGEGSVFKATSGSLRSLSLGDGTATADVSLENLTVDCNNQTSSVGVRVNGAQDTKGLRNVRVLNAKL